MSNLTNLAKTEFLENNDMIAIKGFIKAAEMEMISKEEIADKCQFIEEKLADLNAKILKFESYLLNGKSNYKFLDADNLRELVKNYGPIDQFKMKYSMLIKERDVWEHYLEQILLLMKKLKNFNKKICFANIRELLRQKPNIKIGQIEKEAGNRLGYMSRLEKDGNTSEPTIEFIVSAAKLLKVSVDTLISIDLTSLTPTEQYIINFFDKLKTDTLNDKLDWNRESAFLLNRIEPDINGLIYHPLFALETFYEETECQYPEEVTRIVFNSRTFGPHTYISGDCFNLVLKNDATLYLMDIERTTHKKGDASAYAKEAWMYVPHKGCQLLVSSQDNTPIAQQVEELFSFVKERMEHPKINADVKFAIDSFMNDDSVEN